MDKLSKTISFYIYTRFYPVYLRIGKQITFFLDQYIGNKKNNLILFLIAIILFTVVLPLIILVTTISIYAKLLFASIYLILFILILFITMIYFDLKMMMKEKLVIKKKEELKFGFKESQIVTLYHKLWFDFIDDNKTSKVDFKNVFLKGFNSHNSEVHLKMDHADTKYLITKLKEINFRFTLSKAVKSNKIFNSRGRINQNMLNKAGSANKNIPNIEQIDHIIHSINSKKKLL